MVPFLGQHGPALDGAAGGSFGREAERAAGRE